MSTVYAASLFWRSLWLREVDACTRMLDEAADRKAMLAFPAQRAFFLGGTTFSAAPPEEGQYPLHYLVSQFWLGDCSQNCALMNLLINGNPEIADVPFSDGSFPLHYMLQEYTHSVTEVDVMITKLLQVSTKGVLSNTPRLPIELALEKGCPNALTIATLKASPNSMDELSIAPLQHILMGGAAAVAEDLIAAMLQKYPEAAECETEEGALPLHVALETHATNQMLLEILGHHEDAAKQSRLVCIQKTPPNNCGGYQSRERNTLPLIYAVLDGRDFSVIMALLKAYPEAAVKPFATQYLQNLDGRTQNALLHHLLVGKAPDAHIIAVADAAPEALKIVMGNGDDGILPLHWALKNNKSILCITAILRGYTYAAMIRETRSLFLPLHFAAAGTTPPHLMLELIEAYPQALNEKVVRNGTAWLRPIDLITPSLPEHSMELLSEPVSSYQQCSRKTATQIFLLERNHEQEQTS